MLTNRLFLGSITLALIPHTLAQVGFWALPKCQQICVVSMLDKNAILNCTWTDDGTPDTGCLCSNPDFQYGIRDCIAESCPKGWTNYDNAYLQVCGMRIFGMKQYYDFQSLILRIGSMSYLTTVWGTPSSTAMRSTTAQQTTITIAAPSSTITTT